MEARAQRRQTPALFVRAPMGGPDQLVNTLQVLKNLLISDTITFLKVKFKEYVSYVHHIANCTELMLAKIVIIRA